MEFSRQEYWSGLPFPSPEDLPDPGIEPGFPALEASCLSSELPGKPQFITGFQEICFQVPSGVSGPWTAYSTAFQSLFTSWNLKTSELCPCVYYLFCWNLPLLLHFSASCLCMCVCVKSLQLCPILCDPMDYSTSGSSVHGILQARILEWVAISFSRGSSRPRDRTQVSHTVGRCFNL